MTLIQEPVFRDRNMKLIDPFEREPKRFNRAALKTRETHIKDDTFFLDKLGRFFSFRKTCLGQANVMKSGKTVFQIPLGLAVANEDKLGHRKVFSSDDLQTL